MAGISDAFTMQELYLEILRRSQCNDLDGARVYQDLMEHSELWLSAYPVRSSGGEEITLRDLKDDSHDVDTLYLRAKPEHEAAIEALARAWKADECSVERDPYTREPMLTIRIWWD